MLHIQISKPGLGVKLFSYSMLPILYHMLGLVSLFVVSGPLECKSGIGILLFLGPHACGTLFLYVVFLF